MLSKDLLSLQLNQLTDNFNYYSTLEMKSFFFIIVSLFIYSCGPDEITDCISQTSIINEIINISDKSATINGIKFDSNEGCPKIEEQGFVFSTEPNPTIENSKVILDNIKTTFSETLENLVPNTTYYIRTFSKISELNSVTIYSPELNFKTTCNGVVYLDSNGITVKACDDAVVGDKGTINGVEYTIVDRPTLYQMVANNEDVSNVCTSRITDMEQLFGKYNVNGYNQINSDISSWDVSNVTNMFLMFNKADLNQDISNWDVSNVTNMFALFAYSLFNGDISNWNVGNVIDMTGLFNKSTFNGDISNWDVSNVTTMYALFAESKFNGDISKWNVSKVTDMTSLFALSEFNGDISNWDVSNVTKMRGMFFTSLFNGDISEWNVSNVTDMTKMFYDNPVFNQDLSGWSVSNVEFYSDFDTNTPQWTLPKPIFNSN